MALSQDSHLYVIPRVDEDAVGWAMSLGALETFDIGATAGHPLPSSSSRRLLSFNAISSSETLYATSGIRVFLSRWAAGGSARVYRNYPAVLTVWSASNPEGYDDMVPDEDAGRDASWEWLSAGDMTRFSFILHGRSINAG